MAKLSTALEHMALAEGFASVMDSLNEDSLTMRGYAIKAEAHVKLARFYAEFDEYEGEEIAPSD